jgi:hypothetical protein
MAELPPVFYAPSIDYYGRPAPAARAARPGRAVPNISFRGPQVLLVSSV